MTATLHVRAKSTGAGDDLYGSVAGAAAQSVRGEDGGPIKAAHQPETTMATKTTKLKLHATTGIAESSYGGNVYLQLHAPEEERSLLAERLLAAATYRTAAAIEEGIGESSTCAVCVETGRIHLEFAERATRTEQDRARAVLDQVAGEINRKGRV